MTDCVRFLKHVIAGVCELEERQGIPFWAEPVRAAHEKELAYLTRVLDWHFSKRTQEVFQVGFRAAFKSFVMEGLGPVLAHGAWVVMEEEEGEGGSSMVLRHRCAHVLLRSAGLDDLVRFELVHADGKTPVRSFRHGFGLQTSRTCKCLTTLRAFLEAVDAEGLCEDPVVHAPPCEKMVQDLSSSAMHPALQNLIHCCPRVLPPYAPATLRAFESANNMTLPLDLAWFLTHVSRELFLGDIVGLCEHDPHVTDECQAVQEEVGRLWGTGLPVYYPITHFIAKEVVSLASHGDTDSGRQLRRVNPVIAWSPRPEYLVETVEEALESAAVAAVADRCAMLRDVIAQEHIDTCMGEAWGKAWADAADAADAANDLVPEEEGLFPLTRKVHLDLVMRGPFAGAVIFKYWLHGHRRRVICPTFTSFMSLFIRREWEEEEQEEQEEQH